MKQIPFIKMDGLGNDFVIIDGRKNKISLTPALICKMADRKTGIGFDQLILLKKSTICDVKMEIFNADGSTAGACGNGTRCVSSLIFEETKKQKITLEAPYKKTLSAWRGKLITVDMGEPKADWKDIPLSKKADTLNLKVLPALPPAVCTSMGNPHAVFFVKNVEKLDIAKLGKKVENDKIFPQKTNVEFAQILGPQKIRMRVWERGAGITMACGSGACATLAGAIRRGLIKNKAAIIMDGGTLFIEQKQGRILMSGPVNKAFNGIYFA